jgi:hypothetical protein
LQNAVGGEELQLFGFAAGCGSTIESAHPLRGFGGAEIIYICGVINGNFNGTLMEF